MADIRLVNLVKKYANGFEAVKGVNLEINDGEFLVLVGPSGCGKSTTLRMVAGLEEVTAGDVFIGDQRVNSVEPGKRDIAMVFQNYALYPHMTVRQNMSFGLRMRRTPKAEIARRVDDAAEILSIEPLLDRRPKELSGGQRQRVAVGRAIVRDPAAFLFDEPLSNLDAKLRVQMRTELARLHQRLKTTTVYVTHDQVEAMTLGDRIVVMHEGVIQQVDTPLNLYRDPANRFVAGFIGSPSMNFLEGSVQGGVFHCGELRYALGSSPTEGPVLFGFRPEHVTSDAVDPLLMQVTLDVVERMGHETNVHFRVDETEMVARLEGDATVGAGDKMDLHLPQGQWYLFDVATGERLR
ncbi:MAG: sn-glycerol-3-phosphate ABC transporter ATP-binding protein UgpC [Planctomycetota bacterium]